MGVVGLLTQLVRSTSPAKTVYQNGQSRNILLVDASCVEYEICTQTGADFNTPGVEQTVYDATRTFYDELFKACPGIRIVGIVDSAPGPGHESTYLRRRKERFAEGFALGPVVAAAHLAAASDAGVELIRSVESADPLLLAYYVQHEPRIFGLLTVDSDFFVYGCVVARADLVRLACKASLVWSVSAALFHVIGCVSSDDSPRRLGGSQD